MRIFALALGFVLAATPAAGAQTIPILTAPDGTVLIFVGTPLPPPPPPSAGIGCPPLDVLLPEGSGVIGRLINGADPCTAAEALLSAFYGVTTPGPWYLHFAGWNRVQGVRTVYGPFGNLSDCWHVAVVYGGNVVASGLAGGLPVVTGPGVCTTLSTGMKPPAFLPTPMPQPERGPVK